MIRAKEEEKKAKMMVQANQCTPPKKINKIQQKFDNINQKIQEKEKAQKTKRDVSDT